MEGRIFRIAPIAIAVISIILAFVASPWVLIVGGFLTGVCIGADYPMASMVVSECSPNAYRNRSLVILMMAWYVGALAGSLVGFGLYGLGYNWPWLYATISVFAIFMFGPTIMQMFGLGEGSLSVLGTAVIYIFFMLGVAPAIRRIETMSRRKTVIWTYVIMSIGLTLLGIFSDADPVFILVCFVIYSLAYGLQSVLDNTYPPELFPTEIRGTDIGTVTSISKLGGAVAAQLFPMGLAAWGLGPVVLVGAGISVVGLVISIFLAPETQGKTLEEASRLYVDDPTQAVDVIPSDGGKDYRYGRFMDDADWTVLRPGDRMAREYLVGRCGWTTSGTPIFRSWRMPPARWGASLAMPSAVSSAPAIARATATATS